MTDKKECARCGLPHDPGELFLPVDVPQRHCVEFVDTCELEDAWAAAHAHPQPLGTVASHATRNADAALAHGLDPQRGTHATCAHVCLAETPWVGAWLAEAFGSEEPLVLLEVDVAGLDLFFELGEARHHAGVIAPDRLRVVERLPAPINTGWSDPGWRWQHSDCIALRSLPLSRRLLRHAERVMRDRWPWDAYDDDRFRSVLAEVAAETIGCRELA